MKTSNLKSGNMLSKMIIISVILAVIGLIVALIGHSIKVVSIVGLSLMIGSILITGIISWCSIVANYIKFAKALKNMPTDTADEDIFTDTEN